MKFAMLQSFHLLTVVSLCLTISASDTAASEAVAKSDGGSDNRPNIVFLLIDDLGYADCGFNGGTHIKTPNIDKLARSGAVLESHYVQPVCSPTRAALLTGRYATRTGVYTVVRPGAAWGLPLQERTLANAIQDAGYTTAIVGKWHLGEFEAAYRPMSRGFQHQHGMFFGAIDHFTHVRDGIHDWYHNESKLKEEGYSTQLITREAVRLIEAQPTSKPLFLYVPYNAVHSPLQVPDEYVVPYSDLNGGRKTLAGMLAAVDEGIGEIVAALHKADMTQNTLIVFSSDNGGPQPGTNKPLRGFKGSLYEGGTRGCAFASWPGKIPAGQRITQPMHIVDWYPTLIKLGGGSLEQPLPIDGKDVWPLLTEKAPSPHDAILSVQSPVKAAVRIGDWKLIRQPVDSVSGKTGSRAVGRKAAGKQAGNKNTANPKAANQKAKNRDVHTPEPIELYNLADDISESKNLAKQEPDRVVAMAAKLDELLRNAVPPGNP